MGEPAIVMSAQSPASRLSKEEAQRGLEGLEPSLPWAHYFDLGHGVSTIAPDNTKFLGKAKGLKTIADALVQLVPYMTRRASASELRVLDLACGEGLHSIEFAHAGAKVLGVDGRKLYLDRATFIAHAVGISGATFQQGDVRKVSAAELGTFELVLFIGILHHLGADDFFPMLQRLYEVTEDTLFIYTHVSSDQAVALHKLQGPVMANDRFEGFLFREHADNATEAQRVKKTRASLDNTFSFWARESTLLTALREAGFNMVYKVLHPHPFKNSVDQYRPLIVCRK